MRDGEVIKEIAKAKGISMQELSKRCGYMGRSGVNNRIAETTRGMTTSTLVAMLESMGCELIARGDDGNEWKID